MLTKICGTPLTYWAWFIFLPLLALAGLGWSAQSGFNSLTLRDYYQYRCDTGTIVKKGSVDQVLPRFRFLTISSMHAAEIAEQMCHQPEIAQHYSGVTISWKPRWLLSPDEILAEDYDLIWSRESALQGIVPWFESFYQKLMAFDNYRISWYSKGLQPQMTQEYFSDKRVGILSDRLSHSHHLMALMSLKKAHIELGPEQLVIYDDSRALYEAFAHGEVDLITGGQWLNSMIDAPLTSLLISDRVAAADLFIRRQHPPELDCALIATLNQLQQILPGADFNAHALTTCQKS